MERLNRLLRLARLRGDRVAIATLETRIAGGWPRPTTKRIRIDWTEAELRLLWGDR